MTILQEKKELTFENLVNVLKSSAGISPEKIVTKNTWIERDLNIYGEDAYELIEDIEYVFDITFEGNCFNLKDNENLFSNEGLDLLGINRLIFHFLRLLKYMKFPISQSSIKLYDRYEVKDLMVGELYRVMCEIKSRSVTI